MIEVLLADELKKILENYGWKIIADSIAELQFFNTIGSIDATTVQQCCNISNKNFKLNLITTRSIPDTS